METHQNIQQTVNELDLLNAKDSIERLRVHFQNEGSVIFDSCYRRLISQRDKYDEMTVAILISLCSEIDREELFNRLYENWGDFDVYKKTNIRLCARDANGLTVTEWLLIYDHPESQQHDRRGIFGDLLAGGNRDEFQPYLQRYAKRLKMESQNDVDYLEWLNYVAKQYGIEL
ncbi:hypothetical protein Pla110_11460 [Polystyrenella longa]|uniref:Uncharacterized protein n=1 Tax=Polystyrenella longa TaxID=2528007 RepID=A0A518CJM8_9PLAN|nr:hypothetical protein [Polystyrenella longa]QDU79436.1 hypothetical protein Pla110_11460 [Polystyrenella longa]